MKVEVALPYTPCWIPPGEVGRFPVNETRLKTFEDPLRQPWDGVTALTGVNARNLGVDEQGKAQSWSSPSTSPTWAARSPRLPLSRGVPWLPTARRVSRALAHRPPP